MRIPLRIELRFWRPGDTAKLTGYTTNISKSGFFLGGASSLQQGERLQLEIVDRDRGFLAEGRVVRVHRVALAMRHLDPPGVGVRFLLPEELVEELLPLAKQSGPVTQGGRALDPGLFPPYDPATEDLENPGAAAGPAASAGQSSPGGTAAAREPMLDIDRDKIVMVTFEDPSAFLGTYHRDIRAGGLFVSTPAPMALQDKVWVEMHLPLAGEEPKRFAARVIQRFDPVAAVGPGKNILGGMAVQFLEPETVLAELEPVLAALRR
ncbi:MAG: PilZ domain-containing protein [Thermoanaerobaculia bacterium]